jgi:hypothetical protein
MLLQIIQADQLIIGEGTVLSGSLSVIEWQSSPYYIKLSLTQTGGQIN